MASSSAARLFTVPRWGDQEEMVSSKVVGPIGECLKLHGFEVEASDGYSLDEFPDLVATNGQVHILIDFYASDLPHVSFDLISYAKSVARDHASQNGGRAITMIIGPFDIPDYALEVAESNGVRVVQIPREMDVEKLPDFLTGSLKEALEDEAAATSAD